MSEGPRAEKNIPSSRSCRKICMARAPNMRETPDKRMFKTEAGAARIMIRAL